MLAPLTNGDVMGMVPCGLLALRACDGVLSDWSEKRPPLFAAREGM